MKKIILSFVVVGLTTANLFAQVSGGLRGGLNIANQKISAQGNSHTFNSRIGFMLGGYITAPIGNNVAFQPELYYSSMGAKEEDDSFGEIEFKFGYVALPLYLRYNVNENFNLHLGPQVSFLVSAKGEADGTSDDVKDSFKGLDFGLSFGAGFDFGKFNAGARYYIGMSNISDEEELDQLDVKWTNSTIQLFVGVKLFGE